MAEGFLKSFDSRLEVYSAGTYPSAMVHPKAVEVMKEENIDLSEGKPELVDNYINEPFDYVITVCDGAKEHCPVFTGEVKEHMHIGFDDPAMATGTSDEIYAVFRRVRDEIKRDFKALYENKIKHQLS